MLSLPPVLSDAQKLDYSLDRAIKHLKQVTQELETLKSAGQNLEQLKGKPLADEYLHLRQKVDLAIHFLSSGIHNAATYERELSSQAEKLPKSIKALSSKDLLHTLKIDPKTFSKSTWKPHKEDPNWKLSGLQFQSGTFEYRLTYSDYLIAERIGDKTDKEKLYDDARQIIQTAIDEVEKIDKSDSKNPS